MEKKVIPIPDGTERIEVYRYVSVDEKGAGFPIGSSSYDVKDLPDAPEKRVFELPADMVAKVARLRKGFKNNIIGFVTSFNDQKFYNAFGGKEKTRTIMAEYFNGHVEFEPKKEPKFYVDNVKGKHLTVDEQYGDVYHYPQAGVLNDYQYTEAEADKLVAGLTALNARKVKVED
ncbi:hypothetical protein [Weissella cibaria]|uniref:hypothetical protein n=1 Tax=Weissella cibaria TaxID=137591 RepID=UPI0011910EF4|nr:hypothetical protein [Weissella cibaria]TVV31768.1 hypothetical protein FO434_05770 [Weissella cibaria]